MLKRSLAIIAPGLALAFSAPLALATEGLTGTYRSQISKPATIKGTWQVTFASGHNTVTRNGHLVTHGTYTISGSTITFKHGKKCDIAATYSFALKGTTLKFTKIKDTCTAGHRSQILAHTFTKV